MIAVPAAHYAAPLICIDPGHGTPPSVGRQTEPIGPGSHVLKIKDGGGAPGEAVFNLSESRKLRVLFRRRGYRVAMTRTGPVFRYGNGGNIARAQFCSRRHAALMLRIHADGSTDSSQHGIATLIPAYHRGWTDDIFKPSAHAGQLVQHAAARASGALDRGIIERSDLTGFNWANVPSILVECGFMSNSSERHKLQSASYQWKLARGLVTGTAAFVGRG